MTTFAVDIFRLIRKDLVCQWRAPATWCSALLLGVVLALAIQLQLDLPGTAVHRVVGGLMWLVIYFAGTVVVERSIASEYDDGCWDALRVYPVSPTAVYLAKTLLNFILLCGLTAVVAPLFLLLSGVSLWHSAGHFLLIAALANLGVASLGTLVGTVAIGPRRKGRFIALIQLPLVVPVLLAAGDATRLIVEGSLDRDFWNWARLLGVFSAMFLTLGVLVFEFLVEE
jgi:heme exporter protein B